MITMFGTRRSEPCLKPIPSPKCYTAWGVFFAGRTCWIPPAWAGFAVLVGAGAALILAQLGWALLGTSVVALSAMGAVGYWLWHFSRIVARFGEVGLAQARLAEQLAPELGTSATSAASPASSRLRYLWYDPVSGAREERYPSS